MLKKLNKLRYKLQSGFLKIFAHIKIHPYPFWVVVEPTTFKLKGDSYYEVRDIIRAGDIILRGYDKYLDGYFIAGKYSHASLYVGGVEEKIIHSMTPDVQYTDLVSFMRADRVAVIRFPQLKHSNIMVILQRAKGKIGVPYDYDFIFEEEDEVGRLFSCSELIYYIMKPYQYITNWKLKETSVLFGLIKRDVFFPDDILPTTDNTNGKVIWSK